MKMADKVKYSNFHITVNTNRTDANLVPLLREAVDSMVEGDTLWTWLRQYDGQRQIAFDEETQPLVQRVRIRAALESGGAQNHGQHVHLLLEVTHTTLVQVDKAALVRHFLQCVGCNCNIHVRFLRGAGDDKDFILHYITKEGVPTRRTADTRNAQLARAMRDGEELADVDEDV